jgi:serine/threonine protein phosphatase PrpC
MHLELIDSLTIPGNPDKPNEDAFAHTPRMAAVFDGATGLGENLMPGGSDAAWIARFGARRLTAHSDAGGNPRDWLKRAAQDAEKSFAALRRRDMRERYEMPVASLMLAALADGALEALWLGDCALIVRAPGGKAKVLGDALESRGRERDRVAELATAKNLKPAAKIARDEFMPALRAKRNLINTEKGGWLFAPDPRCAKHARSARAAIEPNALVLLATDGLLALVSDYARYTVPGLLDAAERNGLAALGAEVRAIEAADPDGARFPRFKQSDDATALLLRVVAGA